MANTIAELYIKIEAELDKPEAQQNPAKLAFWREELDKLQTQQPQDALLARLESLERRAHIATDKRLEYWSVIAPPSSGKHTAANIEIKGLYHGNCAVCGAPNATMAHIVSGRHDTSYHEFNTPKYKTDIDNKSPRNYLPLCGVLGTAGSCHNEFDLFLLTFMYNPLSRAYRIISLNELWIHHHLLNGQEIPFPNNPYKRLLVWRTRKCLLEHGNKFPIAEVEATIEAGNLSEESLSLADVDEDADSDVDAADIDADA